MGVQLNHTIVWCLQYRADPGKQQPGETYRHNGGRGFYFDDPDGHLLEVMTRPYDLNA
jgi:catechol 2,3-dioxygenase-like lactoylglutathione lyase family enzyme